jgi:hypothetical protein
MMPLAFALAVSSAFAQQPSPTRPTQPEAPRASVPPLFFGEAWKQTGLERAAVLSEVVVNPNLALRLDGPSAKDIQIAPTTPNTRRRSPNLWTGICTTPAAATLRDEHNYVDPDGSRQDSVATMSALFHVVRPAIKHAIRMWLVGDHADGNGAPREFSRV